MALARCRECQRKVSTEAPSCPHCGVPNPTSGSVRSAEGPEVGAPESASVTTHQKLSPMLKGQLVLLVLSFAGIPFALLGLLVLWTVSAVKSFRV